MNQNRKERRALKLFNKGVCGTLNLTLNQFLMIAKIVDKFFINRHTMAVYDKNYRNIEDNWVQMNEHELGDLNSKLERLTKFILSNEERLKKGAPILLDVPRPEPMEAKASIVEATNVQNQ